MRKGQQASLSALLAVAIAAAMAAAFADRFGVIRAAQAQTEDEKRKKDREKQKAAPPKAQPSPPPAKAPPPPAQPRATVPPPPPPKVPLQKQLPPPEKPAKQFQPVPPPAAKQVPPEKPAKQFQPAPPPAARQVPPAPKPPGPTIPDPKKDAIKRLPPPDKGPGAVPAPTFQKVPPAAKPAPGPGGPTIVAPAPQLGPKGPAPKRFEDVQKGRLERVEDGGRRKVIQEPGNRVIVKQDNRAIIRHDEAERFRRRPDARSERRPDGNVETFYVRPDGVRIVTVVDVHGRLLRRYRRTPDGRERNIIDNRRFYIGVGIVALGIVALNLPPPRVTIPRDRYIVEYDRASDDDLDEALTASPLEPLERPYSLEEIRDNYELRARMRRIDLDAIHFEFGAFEVTPDQYPKLERAARAILRLLRFNPEAVVMVEGHTDAVGSDVDNLSLSDRRAASVAEILSETFGVPPENLVTQGYGEQYLKIATQGPEPLNRRVSIINVTALLAER